MICLFKKKVGKVLSSNLHKVKEIGLYESGKFKSIRGIGDKTYDYLLKLLGVESVAVDRHLYKFVSDAGIIYKNYKS